MPPDDQRYVDFTALGLRGTDGDLVGKLRRNILLADGDENPRLLVSGYRGSGKTTELLRLRQQLEVTHEVIYIDSDSYLNLRVPATVTDLWICIAGAVDDHLAKTYPNNTKLKRFTERVDAFLKSELKFEDLTIAGDGGVVSGSVKLTLKENHPFRKRLNDELRDRAKQPQFVEECRNFVAEAIATLRAKQAKTEGVLIIVDSFEKLRGDHTNVDDVRGSAENIFSRDWDLLKLPCPAIFTVPPWFCFLDASPESSTEVLPMCKLFERGKSELLEDGRHAFLDFLNRRLNLREIFGDDCEAVLEPVIEASGGYPRDLLRLIRDILSRNAEAPALPLDTERTKLSIKAAIQHLGEQYALALDAEDIDLLKHVARDCSVSGLKKSEKLRVADLFENHFVLSYRNGSRWFGLHPLVRRIPEVQAAIAGSV